MTEQELTSVRDLRKKIRDLEKKIHALRLNVENITPVIDGLPHSTEAKSRVEKLAVSIVAAERELAELREQMPQAQAHLAELITREVAEPVAQTLLVLRYVACCSFREVARRMNFDISHVFKLHRRALKKVNAGQR